MSLVHNERVKLTATALNNTAIATVVTGLIAPAVAAAYGLTSSPTGHLWWVVASAWFASGLGLHWSARRVLKGLKP